MFGSQISQMPVMLDIFLLSYKWICRFHPVLPLVDQVLFGTSYISENYEISGNSLNFVYFYKKASVDQLLLPGIILE